MNAAVKTIKLGAMAGVGALQFAWIKKYCVHIIVWTTIFVSALSVIYTTNITRGFYATMQAQQSERQSLHIEWGKLLLEQGTWTSQARVEEVAIQHLHMQLPKKKRMILVD